LNYYQLYHRLNDMQRTHPDQSSGIRDDNNSTGGQWDDSMGQGNQGKWEHKEGEASCEAFASARTITLPVLNVSAHLNSC
jgi:hypothetical protein